MSINKYINNNESETQSTLESRNCTKKIINLNHNITQRMNLFRIGLSSANSISNNDLIIPNRPTSNFIFGGNN